ncbi:hypothetical protein BUE76_07285 [Cnuella takakiae]|nr:hypothetical protein BUE76_07285 [Cnuella takakiae]
MISDPINIQYPSMKTVTLRFPSLENLGRFIQQQEGGYYTNTRMLTVKGCFAPNSIDAACNQLGAEVIEHKN